MGWLAAGVWHEKTRSIYDNAKTPRGPRLPASGQRVDCGVHPSFGLSMPRPLTFRRWITPWLLGVIVPLGLRAAELSDADIAAIPTRKTTTPTTSPRAGPPRSSSPGPRSIAIVTTTTVTPPLPTPPPGPRISASTCGRAAAKA
jgi:hypothetical protein